MGTSTLAVADRSRLDRPRARLIFGVLVVAASALYVATDVVETAQGGFSTAQLWLTVVAEALLPLIVVGLAYAQGPKFGRVGWASTWIYAYSYVFFSATVVYALANGTPDYATLGDDLGIWMVLHGALMLIGGLGIGYATLKAGVFPRWAAIALMTGVVLVAIGQGLPEGVQTAFAGVRALGLAGMGLALLHGPVGSGRSTHANDASAALS